MIEGSGRCRVSCMISECRNQSIEHGRRFRKPDIATSPWSRLTWIQRAVRQLQVALMSLPACGTPGRPVVRNLYFTKITKRKVDIYDAIYNLAVERVKAYMRCRISIATWGMRGPAAARLQSVRVAGEDRADAGHMRD
jgi:hypothetical protein